MLEYSNRKEIIRKVLVDQFSFPDEVVEFDLDDLLNRMEPHRNTHRMNLEQRNIFDLIQVSNYDMKTLNKYKALDDIKMKLSQLEDGERLLEVRRHLPKNFPY